MPKVSIFLSYYNDRNFLAHAIESILAQDFQDFELILLNHATTDNCREIAHSYTDSRIVHIDKDFNYGAGSGLLIRDMLAVARGEYVKFCCADDILHSDCLSKLVEYLDMNPDCDAVCSSMNFIDVNGKRLPNKMGFPNTGCNQLKTIFNGQDHICFPTVMMRTHALTNAPINNTFIMKLDTSLWTELLCRGGRFDRVDDALVDYRLHHNQTTRQQSDSLFLECVAFADIFYTITDVNIVQDLCPDIEYSHSLTDADSKYCSFILALHNLQGKNLSFAIAGYLHIDKLLNDDTMRIDLEERFGFTIADFRRLYKKLPALDNFLEVETKKMGVGRLLKLLGRKVFRACTPKFYRNLLINYRLNKRHTIIKED
ncbi:MAG: glycosyltransferase family 2 protein [Alphaproteobacteria bacterium]|nr:glycosyltransferase family 2 protein [Alphaproteobacteria bacterium]